MTDPFTWVKRYIEGISYKWPMRSEALRKSRRISQLADKRTKFEHQCNHCKKWFKAKDVQLDHIVPKGKYSKETFFVWLERLFCAADGFQVLCKPCHLKKTNLEKKNGAYEGQ